MKYKCFTIKNYKGIKELTLDLNLIPDHKVFTLVGLNESGKTTILEAINDFEFEVSDEEKHLLIPKSSAGGFTGTVSIVAVMEFSDNDKKSIEAFVKKKINVKEIVVADTLKLERKYEFTNSIPGESKRSYWHFVKIKKTVRSKESELESTLSEELWQHVKNNLFPEIIFYKDFLSKFPEKIALEPQGPKEREYISILDDVLTSCNPNYNVQNSLVDRLKNPTEANKQAQEAVENEVAAKISQVVFDAWNKIQQVSKKEITIKSTIEADGRAYLSLKVKEGRHSYAVAERSLGFRWFFTFLLYTEFRKERIKTSGEILFLLDEPASNLHQAAQRSLLETFENIITKSRMIYTTHSHHLINPLWLDSAYIVKNKGLEYKEDDDFNSSKTEIEAYKYKQFVSTYPTETTYFQPILDVLDYAPGLLEQVPKIVITEGKFDFFVFKYFKDVVQENVEEFNFYPGHGASGLDLPIALYESWGRDYLVLLDADREGKKQKARYIKELSDAEHIYDLSDISSELDGFSTEDLFTEAERIAITKEFNDTLTVYDKSAFHVGIQTLYRKKEIPTYITNETKQRFENIFKYILDKI